MHTADAQEHGAPWRHSDAHKWEMEQERGDAVGGGDMIDVEPTAQVIDTAAERFRQTADELNRLASRMRERNDLTYSSEAMMAILNVLQNCRLDLLVTRPIRALSA